MNKIALGLSAALALGAAASANAQSGTITFNGEVTSVTCDVTFTGSGVVGSGNDATVTLPTVATASLGAGNTAGRTPITVHVGGSDAQCTSGTVALELNPSRTALVTPGGNLQNLAAAGAATNVAVALRDSGDRAIDVSIPWSSERVSLSTGGADILFAGEYIAETGAATAGTVNSNVQYTLDYN